ncbi:hypothetical protein GCM10007977_079870 [Dactylosporangium sucinum]|uniref:Uncharacterized protein n=1 Tax=Dactylosporangium sucinum TaxID=1424081 RepID=A0A917U8Z2_9ACTN|nr:hypothetical protein GCM10007977_079870 [Dactylosporangium sucinum]
MAMPSRASSRSARIFSRMRLAASRRFAAGGSATRRPAMVRLGVCLPSSRFDGVWPLVAASGSASGAETATDESESSDLRRNSDGTP